MTISDPLRGLRCLDGLTANDELADELRADFADTPILEVMRRYIEEVRGNLDNEARIHHKLARLFELGRTPETVDGHHDGVALCLRTGDQPAFFEAFGNLMGLLWGTAVGPVAPWVGKSFAPAGAAEIDGWTDGRLGRGASARRGINHFHRIAGSAVNRLSFSVLTVAMHLKDADAEERARYGHEKNGGLFVAHRAPSVYQGTPRDVYRLDYRYGALENVVPFAYLIDELVDVSDGVYLGQLLFATSRLTEGYDASLPSSGYHYQHFGYFLLVDARFEKEVRRVFPNLGSLGAGSRAPVTRPTPPPPPMGSGKLTTLTLARPADGPTNDALFATIEKELAAEPTILDLLATYSHALHGAGNDAPEFDELGELFRRGVGPAKMDGYLRGALISFHTEGAYRFLGVNTLNAAWTFGRFLTPWTGKTFKPLDAKRHADVTGGAPIGKDPVFWGSNTVALRSGGQKLIGAAMKLAGVHTEPVDEATSRDLGYDLQTFFFIGQRGPSIIAENEQKPVFQLNYRYPKLKTFPPDHYCIDEVVELARGLYLGQLIYATKLAKSYDPAEPSSSYEYRVFGYFLLMDEEWQARRLAIGLDPYNV